MVLIATAVAYAVCYEFVNFFHTHCLNTLTLASLSSSRLPNYRRVKFVSKRIFFYLIWKKNIFFSPFLSIFELFTELLFFCPFFGIIQTKLISFVSNFCVLFPPHPLFTIRHVVLCFIPFFCFHLSR